jgi:hypothetical protein
MSHEKIFKKNLDFLQKLDTKLAYKLMSTDPVEIQFCQTEKGELNLCRTYEGQTYFYHSTVDAKAEADEWFTQLKTEEVSVLFIYGVGLGYYYEAARQWLKEKKDRTLVFLEEDPGVIHRLLETELGGTLLRDPQVQLFFFQDLIEDKPLFNEMSWIYVDLPFAITSLKLYEEVNSDGFSKLHHQISYVLIEKKVFAEEYLKYGIVFYRNFYLNLLELPNSYWGNGLFEKFKNIPAIICGAGPSLNKNIDQLSSLKDKALIFAGSSSLSALIPKGVIPHFGAGVDPNQGQLPRVELTAPHKIPFFYRNRLFNPAVKAITGPKLYLTGTGGYDVAEWFENELGIEGRSLDEGHNIVTFCIEIANALGCNPIVIVGLDLAYTNQQPYADGIIQNLKLTPEDLKLNDDFASQPVVRNDITGQPVQTLWKWITEAEWISTYAEKNPEVTLINATEGGLGFEGVPNQTLKETTEQWTKNPHLSDKIEKEIQEHILSNISIDKMKELMRKMQASLDRSILLLDKLMEETDQLQDKIKGDIPYPEKLETPQISLLETDIQDEPAYQYILETFNQVYIRYHYRDIQILQSIKRKTPQKKRDLQKLTLQKGRLGFLKDVARVNRELIERTLNN